MRARTREITTIDQRSVVKLNRELVDLVTDCYLRELHGLSQWPNLVTVLPEGITRPKSVAHNPLGLKEA